MTQNQQIIAHMKRTGSITLREALIDYSVQSLTKRIQELRAIGYKIKSVLKTILRQVSDTHATHCSVRLL